MSEHATDPAPSTEDVLAGANALLGGEEPQAEAESGTDEPEAESSDQQDGFNMEPEVPEDYAELAEMPDFEAEADQELSTTEDQAQEDNEYEYQDDETATLKKRALAAEKRTAWLEEQRVKQNEGKWKAEAIKFFPLSQPFVDAGLIKADSRRGYAREAKRVHEALKPFVKEKFLKPLEASIKMNDAEAVESEAQEKSQKWGPPLAGPNSVPAVAERKSQQFQQNYGMKNRVAALHEQIKEDLFPRGV